jgi:predicted N-formylglutamate amidohydrolase
VLSLEGRLDGGLLLLCDHASNALPRPYGNLGLPAFEFERHIAYDIGAAAATRRMAERLEAPALMAT